MKNDQPFAFSDYLASVDDMSLLFDPLVDILCHVEAFARDSGKQGCLIGIKGDWGSGKTSILRAVEDYFGKGRGWPAIFFEAWKYQDEHQPVLPLLVKLRDVTSGGVKGRLTKAIHLLGVAALTTGDAALKVVTNTSIGEKIGFKDIEKAFQLAGKANMEGWFRFEDTFQALCTSWQRISPVAPDLRSLVHGRSSLDGKSGIIPLPCRLIRTSSSLSMILTGSSLIARSPFLNPFVFFSCFPGPL